MNRQPAPQFATPKENLRATRVFFFAMITAVMMFVLIATGLHFTGSFGPAPFAEHRNIVLAVAAVIAVFCLIIARFTYNKGVDGVKNLTGSVNEKLNYYRSYFIRYMALCDGAAIFSVIAFFSTAQYETLIITAVALAAMVAKMPAKKTVVEELNLNWKEQEEL